MNADKRREAKKNIKVSQRKLFRIVKWKEDDMKADQYAIKQQ